MAAERTVTDASTTATSPPGAAAGSSGPAARRSGRRPPASPPRPGALPVLRWVLRVHRRALVGWGVALALVTALYVSFWPAMGDTQEMQALIDSMPEALVTAMGYDAISSPAGYLESTVYGLLAPILMLVFAIGFGARLIAGDEEAGALELEAAGPVTRRRLLLERYAALVLAVGWLAVVTGLASLALARVLGMDIGTAALVGATVGLALLVLALGSVAFAVGAATGRRALALALAAAVAVLGYMANALAPLLADGEWLERLSPFAWYLGNDPLNEGLGLPGALALVALAAVSLGVAVVAYDRRDLGV